MKITLPLPPSQNALFANRKQKGKRGRVYTDAYTSWREDADQYFLMQKRGLERVSGPYALHIKLPQDCKLDLDNAPKSLSDYLVSRELTSDDKLMQRLLVERCGDIEAHLCQIEVWPA